MSALVLCSACQTGDHDRHDPVWHGTPGVIGGYQCPCPGGCAPQPSPFDALAAPAPVPDDGPPNHLPIEDVPDDEAEALSEAICESLDFRPHSLLAEAVTIAVREVAAGYISPEAHVAAVDAALAEAEQAIRDAKPKHFTRDYTATDAAFDRCAAVVRTLREGKR